MKTRTMFFPLLTILCVLLAVAPAMADTLYDNGPLDGNTWAWPINFGRSVSDSFEVAANSSIRYLDFVYYTSLTSDLLTTVDMAVGNTSFGGTPQTFTAVSNTDMGGNQFGYEMFQAKVSVGNIPWSGDGFITLSNVCTTEFGCSTVGEVIYWDQNSGIGCPSPGCPSTGYANDVGSIPSETFTLTGSSSTGPPPTTPEPSSIMLFGSGVIGLVGILRRKLGR